MKKLQIFDELIDIIEKEIRGIEIEIDRIEDKDIKKKSRNFYISNHKSEIKRLQKSISHIEELKQDLKEYYKIKKKNKKKI